MQDILQRLHEAEAEGSSASGSGSDDEDEEEEGEGGALSAATMRRLLAKVGGAALRRAARSRRSKPHSFHL